MLPSGEKLFDRSLPFPRGLRYGGIIAAVLAAGFLAYLAGEATRPRDPGQATVPCSEVESRRALLKRPTVDEDSPDYWSVQARCRFLSEITPLIRSMVRCDRRPTGADIEARLDATIDKHRQECGW